MNVDKFTITSYDELRGFDRQTKTLEMVLDELTDFTLSQEEEKTDITGKGGRVVSSLKKNKKVTGSGTNGFLCGGALAVQLGTDVEDNSDYIYNQREDIEVKGNKVTTLLKAEGTAGNEIGTVYVRDTDNVYISGGKKLTQAASAEGLTTGKFAYNPTSKELTFFEGDVADGTIVTIFYDAKVEGRRIANDADNYSKTLDVYIDVTCKDMCDKTFHGQFHIERADFSGTFDITGGSDPSTQAFEFTSLPNLCTGKHLLWDFIVQD